MRYRFYREHKYVSYILSELERLIAKTDFRSKDQADKVKEALNSAKMLLQGHATHEDKTLHELLRQKGSSIHESIEADHKRHEEQFREFNKKLEEIAASSNAQDQLSQGYYFYLAYRAFVGDNLRHIHEEETIIMPELQKLYSDDELRAVEFNTYAHMTPEQIIHMMEVLFPHMNTDDHEVFLTDVKEAEPAKFIKVWSSISFKLNPIERENLIKKLAIV